MATANYRLSELIHKHMTGSLSETDNIELNQIISDPAKRKLFEELIDPEHTRAEVKSMSEGDEKKSWQQIKAAYHFNNKSIAWKKYLAAALLLPFAVGVTWYFWQRPARQTTPTVQPAPATTQYAGLTPRSQRAVWKRSAGLAVYLDDLKNGVVGNSDGGPVKNDSELVFPADRQNDIPLPDTVRTLKGGYYRLRLPDGSKVVLNSASSVFFASAFGNDRQVSVNGEAWFEVKKDPARPFYVHASGMKIQVYGTRFNVKAYPDEDVKTSLLEGSVKVTAGKQNLSLKPGEQAVLKKKKLQKVTDPGAIKKATAWKNGVFIFENDDLKSIIGQLCRSYNLEVEYKGGELPDKTFVGTFYQKNPVEYILDYLHDRSGIKFTKEGNKIIVEP